MMGHALIIFLKIQIAEAVWFLGLAPLFRLSDSFSPPALQVLVHRAVPGSGALSPAAKPPRQPGTAMCELIVLNKRPDQKYQEDHYSDPQYPEKYLDHIDKYHCRTAGGRIFFPGSCRLRSVVVVAECVSSVVPVSSADSVVSVVFSRKRLLPFSAAVKSRDAVPSTTSL